MFLRPIPGYVPSPTAHRVALDGFDDLAARMSDLIDAGDGCYGLPVRSLAASHWATCHGHVGLEISRVGPVDIDWESALCCACSTRSASRCPDSAADTARGRLRGGVVPARTRSADRRSRSTGPEPTGTGAASSRRPRTVHAQRRGVSRSFASTIGQWPARRHRLVTGSNGRSPQRLNTIMGTPSDRREEAGGSPRAALHRTAGSAHRSNGSELRPNSAALVRRRFTAAIRVTASQRVARPLSCR